MTDRELDRTLHAVDEQRRSFIKKMVGLAFAAPAVASFTLDAFAPAEAFGNATPTGQHYPNQPKKPKPPGHGMPNQRHPNQRHPNQRHPNQHHPNQSQLPHDPVGLVHRLLRKLLPGKA